MITETEQETKEQMQKTIFSLETKLQRIRTGRANPALLDSVEVDYYGSNTPISQMSNIAVEDAKTLSIVPTPVQVTALFKAFPSNIVKKRVNTKITTPRPTLFINSESIKLLTVG